MKLIIKILLIFLLISSFIYNLYVTDYFENVILSKHLKEKSLIKIFIMTHKDFINKRYNHIYYIVADDIKKLKNKYNLNIINAKKGKLFKMSRAYCEMSKLYFIYQMYKEKKIFSKYIGLNHYRRYFEFTDQIPDLDDIFENYDVILPKKDHHNTSVKERYCKRHICKIFIDSLNIIKRIKPDYYDTALKFANNTNIYYFNIFIMKIEDFYKYCEFMFDVLFELNKKYNFKTDYDVLQYTKKIFNDTKKAYRQSRIYGFLSERLGNIFYNKYFKRIKEIKIT